MTTVTQATENPKTTNIDLNLTSPTTTESSPTQQPIPNDESNPKSDELVKANNGETVIQKKMKRAERFGTAVHLSESEKRNSRAERFGTASTGNRTDSTKQAEELKKKKAREERFGTATTKNGSDSTKEAEELKKKARAERFGIVKPAPADVEVKKKARLSRLGSSTNNDPIDEEKKKARAIRFSDQGAGKKSNGNENIEVKSTDTVNADGAT